MSQLGLGRCRWDRLLLLCLLLLLEDGAPLPEDSLLSIPGPVLPLSQFLLPQRSLFLIVVPCGFLLCHDLQRVRIYISTSISACCCQRRCSFS